MSGTPSTPEQVFANPEEPFETLVGTPEVDPPPGSAAPDGAHRFLRYVAWRLGTGLLVVLGVSIFVFAATNVLPGDAATALLGQSATPERLAAVREELQLDRPLPQQYWEWISGLVQGDLGHSYAADAPVSELIGDRITNSLVLAGLATLLMVPIAFVLGVLAGVYRGGRFDSCTSVLGLVGVGVPDFVWGTLLALVFGVILGIVPPVSIPPPRVSPLGEPSVLVLPVLTLVIVGLAYLMRMIRAGMVEVMRAEYITQARLSGVHERRIIWWHALRNALAPSVQMIALTLLYLVGGVVVVETVFSYPGIGEGLVQAVQGRDVSYVQTVSVIIATLYVVINIASDLLVVYLVPRLRTGAMR